MVTNGHHKIIKRFLIGAFIAGFSHGYSQIKSPAQNKAPGKKPVALAPIGADCQKAIFIKGKKYGPTIAPDGYGEVNEFPKGIAGPKRFEAEHNSAWYIFTAPASGRLTFQIIPVNPKDDYDFLLYQYDSTSFCRSFSSGKIVPIRGNLAHNDLKENGITGLSADAKNEFVAPGPGDPFSKFITVKKGEQFCLIVDNVHENGAGHTIILSYADSKDTGPSQEKNQTYANKQMSGARNKMPEKAGISKVLYPCQLAGNVVDEKRSPLKSQVILFSDSGREVGRVFTGPDGQFVINWGAWYHHFYSALYYNDSSMIEFEYVGLLGIEGLTSENRKKVERFHTEECVMKKLIAGKRYYLSDGFFSRDGLTMDMDSVAPVVGLKMMLDNHPKMILRLDVHVLPSKNGHKADQELSDARAALISKLLIRKGLDKNRISVKGVGSENPVQTMRESQVELVVVSMN